MIGGQITLRWIRISFEMNKNISFQKIENWERKLNKFSFKDYEFQLKKVV